MVRVLSVLKAAQLLLVALDETVDVLSQLPAGAWSTIGMDNLTIKFFGNLFAWSRIQASRVGSQCRLVGVNLQTSKILFK